MHDTVTFLSWVASAHFRAIISLTYTPEPVKFANFRELCIARYATISRNFTVYPNHKCQSFILLINYHHHHYWHNSPFWAKAYFRSFCQLSLFLAAFLQFLSPNFLASSITPSSHLSFGLPLCLLPSTTATRTLLVALCSTIPITCPAHLNWLILMYVTILLGGPR